MAIIKQLLLIAAISIGSTANAKDFRVYPDTPLKICDSHTAMVAIITAAELPNLVAAQAGVRTILRGSSCTERSGIGSISGASIIATVDEGKWGLGYGEIHFLKLRNCSVFNECYLVITRNTIFGYYEDATHASLASRRTKGVLDFFFE